MDALRQIYNQFDPLSPAHPEQYVDCSTVRGGQAMERRWRRELRLAKNLTEADKIATLVLDLAKFLEPYDTSVTEIYLV